MERIVEKLTPLKGAEHMARMRLTELQQGFQQYLKDEESYELGRFVTDQPLETLSSAHVRLSFRTGLYVDGSAAIAPTPGPLDGICAIDIIRINRPPGVNFMGLEKTRGAMVFRGEKRHLDTFINHTVDVWGLSEIETAFQAPSLVQYQPGNIPLGLEFQDFASRIEIIEFAIFRKGARDGQGRLLSVIEERSHGFSAMTLEDGEEIDQVAEHYLEASYGQSTSSDLSGEELHRIYRRLPSVPVLDLDEPPPNIELDARESENRSSPEDQTAEEQINSRPLGTPQSLPEELDGRLPATAQKSIEPGLDTKMKGEASLIDSRQAQEAHLSTPVSDAVNEGTDDPTLSDQELDYTLANILKSSTPSPDIQPIINRPETISSTKVEVKVVSALKNIGPAPPSNSIEEVKVTTTGEEVHTVESDAAMAARLAAEERTQARGKSRTFGLRHRRGKTDLPVPPPKQVAQGGRALQPATTRSTRARTADASQNAGPGPKRARRG